MKSKYLLFTLAVVLAGLPAVQAQKITKNKKKVIASVEEQQDRLIEISDKIWSYAEKSLEETQSSKTLSDYAEQQGFSVEKGVAEMPTAFIASYGSGKPVIGILGEFDALPGLSQKAEPVKSPLEPGKPGHGCGHNLFGAASLGAAVAIKELIESGTLQGTVRFYGTPAEELYGGKIYMAREGLFDDLDVCMDWHPTDEIESAVQSSQALIDFRVTYKGQAAHAAYDPWNGVSAVDALDLYSNGINYLREHVKPTVRIHTLIEKAGSVVNVVPEEAVMYTRVRDRDREGMYEVYEKVLKVAEGASIMTGAEYNVALISGMHEKLVNRTGGKALQENLEALGPIEYTEEEQAFARKIQAATGKEQTGLNGAVHPLRETAPNPPGGSTDVGDVSWNTPVISLGVTSAPSGTPWHSWAVVACGGMSIGHKSVTYAAKALAMTMVDLYEDEKLVEAVQAEFNERKGNTKYEPILPEGPPPVPGVASKD